MATRRWVFSRNGQLHWVDRIDDVPDDVVWLEMVFNWGSEFFQEQLIREARRVQLIPKGEQHVTDTL